jgi:hypothetical protein
MRTRTAKKLAQRIDLSYFKRPHPLRRWRTILSIVAPVAGLLWLGGMAIAGNRAPYTSGPVSTAHAFTEMRCEVCHVRDDSFRGHVSDLACVTCHDGPPHTETQTSAPACATCHRDHQGRIELASTRDEFCIDCHSGATRTAAARADVTSFPEDHPPFTATQEGYRDPGTVRFNHQVHAKPDLRGPGGPETLECVTCHQPEIALASNRRQMGTGLMKPIEYEQQCARCHPLFFDELIDSPAPHDDPKVVRAFVERALREHIAKNPGDIARRDVPARRLPLNFPRAAEPAARTPQEWASRRGIRAERLLWEKTCAECHHVGGEPLPSIAAANLQQQWMERAAFDHMPHLMVRCESCHAAEQSRETSDVLMPAVATCATCHAPDKGASSQCAECHRYHDWTKARPVRPAFDLDQFH